MKTKEDIEYFTYGQDIKKKTFGEIAFELLAMLIPIVMFSGFAFVYVVGKYF